MLIVTGAAGFIGSCLVSELNRADIEDIILSDDFTDEEKTKTLLVKNLHIKLIVMNYLNG